MRGSKSKVRRQEVVTALDGEFWMFDACGGWKSDGHILGL